MKFGKHKKRKRGTEKKRKDNKWGEQSEEGTGKEALKNSVYNRLLIRIVLSGSQKVSRWYPSMNYALSYLQDSNLNIGHYENLMSHKILLS